ncbi:MULTISPECIES: BLUF domain-containing protein [unclassified Brevundimonas]|uniref:BLUF domain-containing protein n=1 Tax=unclassified Brevundimonas TaxID=2622653 RepID=UPI0025B90244|nr:MULTISPECIES: BLUF domain-containing protein [unclassified Brevundimonas]
MNDLDCLVYISRCRLSASELPSALDDIVTVARYRNAEAKITGILTVQDGFFIQLLEGAPAALDLLMIHLHFDERHEDIRVIARQRVHSKHALDWSMIAPPADHPLGRDLSAMLENPPQTVTPWRQVLLQMVNEVA